MADGPLPLPRLRAELELVKGAASVTGEPTWLVYDPLQHKFIQIDFATYHVLSMWETSRTFEELLANVAAKGRVGLDKDSAGRLIDFLHQNKLTTEAPREGWRYFAEEKERGRHSPFMWLVHNYLFFRIPLCRPQGFLERTLPIWRALSSYPAIILITMLGVDGLYLVSRQWDDYIATFQNFFNWEGAILIALTLGLVKAAHELGHAYTAVRFGCRVPTMGLAFIVMAPLLYTDVTEAWRLRDRRQRFLIDSAGIRVEFSIAAVALFLWAFLPEGPLRSLAFVLSAVSVITSLLLNLNPFMRFDGYYLLSETLGVENLQPRAFELGRWKLREWLFGLGRPCPEHLPRRLTLSLIVYAWSVWIYRIGLFVGIALVVYHYFFKVLGVILFAVEIIFFVARPIWSEMRAWVRFRSEISRSYRFLAVSITAAAVVLLCVVPWSTRVEIPSVFEYAGIQRIYPKRPARIARVHVKHGDTVSAGQPLVSLVSPDIDHDIALSQRRLRLARVQFARRGADVIDRQSSLVLEDTIGALLARIAGLEKEREELVVKAPIGGLIVEMNPALHPQRWISPKDLVAVVAEGSAFEAKGYLAETDLARIATGNIGRFIPEQLLRAGTDVVVGEIAIGSAPQIEMPDLASIHGGRIAVIADEKRRLVPTIAHYLVRMPATGFTDAPDLAVRGVVLVQGTPESVLARVWRQTLKVVMREAGA